MDDNTILHSDLVVYDYKYNKLKGDALRKFLDTWK